MGDENDAEELKRTQNPPELEIFVVCSIKECSFCEDTRFARTGVCISCDAGMCRSYFHVTCAQKEGLLSEAAAEEVRAGKQVGNETDWRNQPFFSSLFTTKE